MQQGASMATKRVFEKVDGKIIVRSEEMEEFSQNSVTVPPPPYYDLLLVTTERDIANRGGEDDE